MKIYIYRYGSICEPDVIEAFKRMGLTVDEETIEITRKDLLPAECVKHTSSQIMNGGYSFVFSINFFPWLSEVCRIANIVYISLIVDSPVMELYSNSLSNSCNRVFLFDRKLYEEFSPYNPGHVFHVPLATNMVRNDRVIREASSSVSKYADSQYRQIPITLFCNVRSPPHFGQQIPPIFFISDSIYLSFLPFSFANSSRSSPESASPALLIWLPEYLWLQSRHPRSPDCLSPEYSRF